MKSEMVVCNVYQLFRNGTSYTKEGRKLLFRKRILSRAWVEEKQAIWKDYGKHYEILDEETDKFYAERDAQREKRREAEKVGNQLKDMLTHTLKKANESIDESKSDLELLRDEYESVFKKQVPLRYKNNVEWIETKLKEQE